jgi:hypothetical protein
MPNSLIPQTPMPDPRFTCAPREGGGWARSLVSVITLSTIWSMLGVGELRGESTAPSQPLRTAWSFVDGDCGLTVRARSILAATNRTPAAESVELQAGTGSQAFATYQLPQQVPIITELTVRLRIKSDRAGLQLHARAVLPRSERDAGPRTVLLPGPKYTNVGEWQTLKMHNLNALLEQHVRVSRANTGETLDTREALIDLIAVNVYGGRGKTEVALAIPDVDGAIVQRSNVETELASLTRLPTPVNHSVQVVNGVMTIDDRPFAPRVVRPQGESWSFLKQIGFNTVWLAAPASAQQMAAAERLDLWLIAPVPALKNYAVLNSHMYRRVVAWDLKFSNSKPTTSQSLADQIRDACGIQCKPLLADAAMDAALASQYADILVHDRPILGTTLPTSDYREWFWQRVSGCLSGTSHWAAISTHIPSRIQRQISAFQSESDRPAIAHEPGQLWQAAVTAIASGARVICVADETRLDGEHDQSRLRAAAVTKLNLQHRNLAPWLVSGRPARMRATNHTHLELAMLHTDRATLVIPMHRVEGSQFCAAEITNQPVELTIAGGSDAANVFLVRPVGLEKIPSQRVAGGTQFQVPDLTTVDAILLASDDRIAGNLSAKIRRRARRSIENEQAISKLLLATSQRVQSETDWVANTDAPSNLRATRQMLSRADSALKTGNLNVAAGEVVNSLQALHRTRREFWQRQTSEISPATCPLAASFESMPAFRRWQTLNPHVARGVNLLRGSSFEELEPLLNRGWVADRAVNKRMETQVSLTEQGRQGRCLRLAADGPSSTYAEPIVWVNSAPLTLAAGQQVRIEGWLKVRPAGDSQRSTAAVFDSWAGPQLAHRLRASSQWRPFTMYRIGTGEPLIVTCALTGPGELLVDDLLVSPLSATSITGR